MRFNGNSFVLVQHPKLVREPEQVTIAWLYRQMDMLNDGKWLIEGLGGLQPVNAVSKHNVSKTKLISVITKHSQLINTHPDNQFVGWVTETPINVVDAAEQYSLIIRRRCSEDYSVHGDLWARDQAVRMSEEFFENHLLYSIDGPGHVFVDSCLMVNK